MNALEISEAEPSDVHFESEGRYEDGCDIDRIPSEKRIVDSVGNLTIH
jgi:hypothetical protein